MGTDLAPTVCLTCCSTHQVPIVPTYDLIPGVMLGEGVRMTPLHSWGNRGSQATVWGHAPEKASQLGWRRPLEHCGRQMPTLNGGQVTTTGRLPSVLLTVHSSSWLTCGPVPRVEALTHPSSRLGCSLPGTLIPPDVVLLCGPTLSRSPWHQATLAHWERLAGGVAAAETPSQPWV